MGGRGGGGRLCGLVVPSLGNKLFPEQQSQWTRTENCLLTVKIGSSK